MRGPWKLQRGRLRCTGVPSPDRPLVLRVLTAPTLLGAVVLVGALSACTPDPGQPPTVPPSAAPPSSAVTSSPDAQDLRGRLAAGLQQDSPASSRLVADQQTTLTPVAAAWLPGWQIVDVESITPPHPKRFYAALSDDGQAQVLSGQPDRFSALLTAAGVSVSSADDAGEIAVVFLDSTRDFVTLSYRVEKADDIGWRPSMTVEQQQVRDQVLADYGDQITPPKASKSGSGWTVTAWTITGTDLVRHQVSVAGDGAVSDATEIVASDLPVPASR